MSDLDEDLIMDVLDFERLRFKLAGSKERMVRERFEIDITRYYQLLNRVLDDPRALALHPLLVNTLRRRRDAGQARRDARRLA